MPKQQSALNALAKFLGFRSDVLRHTEAGGEREKKAVVIIAGWDFNEAE